MRTTKLSGRGFLDSFGVFLLGMALTGVLVVAASQITASASYQPRITDEVAVESGPLAGCLARVGYAAKVLDHYGETYRTLEFHAYTLYDIRCSAVNLSNHRFILDPAWRIRKADL